MNVRDYLGPGDGETGVYGRMAIRPYTPVPWSPSPPCPLALIHEALDLICQLKQRRSLSSIPSSDLWLLWWELLDGVTDDFMAERSQPQAQPREDIFPYGFLLDTNICIYILKRKPIVGQCPPYS